MATRKLPKGATTKRPSSRGYASNRAVIENLVAPEKVAANYPSTMSGNRDVQRQAFAQQKTGISKNYKMVGGKLTEISEDEWKQAAKRFAAAEKKIPKGTSLNQGKAVKLAKMDAIKQAVAKVQGVKNIGSDTLTAAERKMAREGNAPARAPATPPTPKPDVSPAKAVKAPKKAAAPKVATTAAAPKMTRAERSAANKAKHAVTRAAEEKKWAEQKAAKKAGTVKAPAKVKATAAKPAAPTKTVATPAAKKPVVAKPAKVASAPKVAPQVTKPTVTASPQAAPTKAFAAGEKAGNFVKAVGTKGGALIRNIGRGLLSAGSIGFTAATYSKDLGNKAADDAVWNRLKAAKDAASKKAATNPAPVSKPIVETKKTTAVTSNTSTFGTAFKQARQNRLSGKAGDTFEYGGKTYTSYQKGEQPKVAAPKAAAPEMPKSAARTAWNASKATDMGTIEISKPAQNNQMQQSISAMQLEEQFKKRKGPR